MSYPSFTPLRPKTGIIGHRGISALAPENTLAGFKLAAEQGLDWIEFDVRLTKEGALIIFHDATLERTTYSIGAVKDSTLEQLSLCDAGSWFSHHFAQEKIPVLSKDLPALLDLNLFLNIELKVDPKTHFKRVQKIGTELVKILKTQWASDRPLPLISSFHWPLLHKIRAQLPDVPLGFAHQDIDADMIKMVAQTPNASLHTHYRHLSVEFLSMAQQYALPIFAYTVNEPKIAQALLQAGVFAIFSDDPPYLLKTVTPPPEKDPFDGTFTDTGMLLS